jgi:hypothetical protein
MVMKISNKEETSLTAAQTPVAAQLRLLRFWRYTRSNLTSILLPNFRMRHCRNILLEHNRPFVHVY